MFYLRQKTILINLIVLLFCWISTGFNSYTITYLLNQLGQEYINYVCTSITALIAFGSGGFIFMKVGIKLGLGGCYLCALFGGIVALLYSLKHQQSPYFIIFWQFVQFGVSGSFQILYVSHFSVFPTLFASSSYGFLNFMSVIASILSPQVAELGEPTPVIVCTSLVAVSFVSIFFL